MVCCCIPGLCRLVLNRFTESFTPGGAPPFQLTNSFLPWYRISKTEYWRASSWADKVVTFAFAQTHLGAQDLGRFGASIAHDDCSRCSNCTTGRGRESGMLRRRSVCDACHMLSASLYTCTPQLCLDNLAHDLLPSRRRWLYRNFAFQHIEKRAHNAKRTWPALRIFKDACHTRTDQQSRVQCAFFFVGAK
jgi:hypothetical protein